MGSIPAWGTKFNERYIMEEWEKLMHKSTDASWKAAKFAQKLKDHKQQYPEFIIERVAEWFSNQDHKYQGKLVYEKITDITKGLRKIKYRTEAEIQAECDYNAQFYKDIKPQYDKDKDPYGG